MQSSNPVFNSNVFSQERSFGVGESMSIQGTVNKSLALFVLVLISASFVWGKVLQPTSMFEAETAAVPAANLGMYLIGGSILGLIAALVTMFKREWAGITAPIYALCQGVFLGALSAVVERMYPGLVIQAVALTFGTMFCLLMAYKSGMIKVTEKFKLGVVAATGGIAVVYLLSWILSFFHVQMPFLYSSSPIGIGFSLVVVVIAALNLVLDFDMIEKSASMNLPRYMEWYCAFGLMVTLIWLYLEFLKLLMKLRGRNNG